MTFDELQATYGTQNPKDWHQHKHGGAWIYKEATVSDTVFIGPKAVVWGGTIWGGTIWGGTINGGTIEGGTINGGTIWGGTIWGGTIWGGTIKGGTIWGGTIEGGTIEGGTIKGGTWKTTPLFISGSRFELSNAKPGHIQIGCECHPYAWWESKAAAALAKAENFTKAEIKEYRAYIKLFKAIGK